MDSLSSLPIEEIEQVNLGCPKFCKDYICVDLYPKDKWVIKSDVIKFLKTTYNTYKKPIFKQIRAYNLLEHLKNPRLFIYLCYINLKNEGILELKTDNALNPIHYIPNPFHVLTGSHVDEDYHYIFTKAKHTKHYYIFTKLHLRNLLYPYFNIKEMKYTTFFSRIYVLAEKNHSLIPKIKSLHI